MKALGIIPARAGSKRIPGKNKKDFCGKPLITYMIEAALKSELLDKIVVNTDDEDILEIARQYSGVESIPRPEAIAGDEAKAIAYVQQTLELLEQKGETFDEVVILQPTSPLTLAEDIDGTIQLLRDKQSDSAVSVVKLDHATHPIKMKVMEGTRLLPYIEEERGRMAENELPTLHVRNCSVYVSTIETIAAGKVIGDDCHGYEMPMQRSVDINDQVDFDFAEFLYLRKKTEDQ